jgi:transcriptional regulator with XRE-family HTH domain
MGRLRISSIVPSWSRRATAWITGIEQTILVIVPESAQTGSYGLIAQQLLRALRARRSQRAFARRLGYAGNPITDWEHGRRVPSANEVLRAARLTGLDVPAAFARFHPATLGSGRRGYELAAWMNAIRGTSRAQDVAQRAGVSRFAVGRWLRGESEPRLHDFMHYIDATTARLYDWVAQLVPIAQVPALRARYDNAVAIRNAAQDAPWIEAVLRGIETPRYRALGRHRPGALAEILGIPLEHERRALQVLRRARSIRKRGHLYQCVDATSVDMRGDPARVAQLLRHWSEVAAQRVDRRSDADLFAYSVSSLSERDAKRAQDILRRAFREIRSLVKASQPIERVMLVNLQLVLLDGRTQA